MFTIGEFSKITGLSVKTLRFYHEEGLLVPTAIDDQSGYRYYDGSLAEIARTIAFLDKRYRLSSPCREVYLKGPGMVLKGNPKNYLTEIQLMIEE
jgi:hypothetical protein